MTKHEIAFGAVVCDENFAMLIRAEVGRVDVEVRVELEHCDAESAGFQQSAEGRRGYAFAQTRHYAAGNEYEFCHGNILRCFRMLEKEKRSRD